MGDQVIILRLKNGKEKYRDKRQAVEPKKFVWSAQNEPHWGPLNPFTTQSERISAKK